MLNFQNDYGYAIGVIRVLESKILTNAHYQRMLETCSAEKSYRVLYDTDFSDAINKYPSVYDFEKAVEYSLLETKDLLNKITPNNFMIKGIFIWYDFYNVKTTLKAFLQEKKFENIKEILSPIGLLDNQKICDFIFGNFNIKKFQLLKEKAINLYGKNKSIRIIDFIFDKDLYNFMLKWAKKIKSSFIERYIKKQIDLTNVKIFLRVTDDVLTEYNEGIFIDGGTYSWEQFNVSHEKRNKLLISILGNNEQALNIFNKNRNHQYIDKLSEDILIDFIQETKYISEGPVPIMGYWLARKRSSDIIRNILVNKLNGINNEDIRRNTMKIDEIKI